MIKKKQIVEHVSSETHLNKRDAREALENALSFIHERLSDGEEVQIPPLGKIKVITQNEGTTRQKIVYRLILSKAKDGETDQEDDASPDDEAVDGLATAAE